MISTAIQIQEATGDAVTDFSTMLMAKKISEHRESMTEQEFIEAIWSYSAHLASLTATLVSNVCLTKDQMDEMINTIKEFEQLEKEME
jgi:hypothetical protein